jgi:hypothetical protein
MQYVRTNGQGYSFTREKSEAMHFATAAQAQKLKNRLAPQFPNYLWEVLTEPECSYLIVHANKK